MHAIGRHVVAVDLIGRHVTSMRAIGRHAVAVDLIVLQCAAVPDFVLSTNQLRNVNVSDGDSVVFSCQTYAQPPAAVVWLRNTVPLDGLYIISLLWKRTRSTKKINDAVNISKIK